MPLVLQNLSAVEILHAPQIGYAAPNGKGKISCGDLSHIPQNPAPAGNGWAALKK